MANDQWLTTEEAKDIYLMLGKIKVNMPGGYSQRYLKWYIKSLSPLHAKLSKEYGFISNDSAKDLEAAWELVYKKPIFWQNQNPIFRLNSVYEALLFIYMHRLCLESVGTNGFFKLAYRGQRDYRWKITSTKERMGEGKTAIFTAMLKDLIESSDTWAFPQQLNAAAQHYGFPTDLIDFSVDPDIAAYFAVSGRSEPPQAVIHVTDLTSEADTTIVFLPPIFRRIHNQAGVFLEASSFSTNLSIVFDVEGSENFEVFDYFGRPFNPIDDPGPISQIAKDVQDSSSTEKLNEIGGRRIVLEPVNYDIFSAFIQEVTCSFPKNKTHIHPELVEKLIVSNQDWWEKNIETFVDHCRQIKDAVALERAIFIKKYYDTLRNYYKGRIPRNPVQVIFDPREYETKAVVLPH